MAAPVSMTFFWQPTAVSIKPMQMTIPIKFHRLSIAITSFCRLGLGAAAQGSRLPNKALTSSSGRMAAYSGDRPRPDLIEKSADPDRPEPLSHAGGLIISQSMKLIKGDRQEAMGGHRTVIAILGRALMVRITV